MFLTELDCVETKKILDLTTEWLKPKQVQQQLWRTAFKLVAKNFFVDVETAGSIDRVKGNREWFEIPIRQRKPGLFKVRFNQTIRGFCKF